MFYYSTKEGKGYNKKGDQGTREFYLFEAS